MPDQAINLPPRYRGCLHDSLDQAARRHPGKTAIVAGDRSCSFLELHHWAERLAAHLASAGIARGDRVGLFLENRIETAVGVFAILKAGAVFVVVNPQTRPDKLRYIVEDCGLRALLSEQALLSTLNAALTDVRERPDIILADAAGADHSGGKMAALAPILSSPGQPWLGRSVIPSDLAALIYTSGSTGTPKGVMHTHQSMTFARDSIAEYLRLSGEDVILNVLPLAFDYGLYQLLLAVELGATLVLERSFAFPGEILERVTLHGVTVFPGVPTLFALLIGGHRRNPLSYPSVRRVTNTAAALPPEHVSVIRDIFPNALIFAMYGLTECKRISYLPPEWVDSKPGSVGIPIPGTAVELRDEQGSVVAPNEPGILHVRGPHLMRGYWNNPERTARMLIPGDFLGDWVLRTGDWFRMDEDGCLYFIGRSDDIIKTRGEKVSPAEVERALASIPGVLEAAVIGIADEILGQRLKAFIVAEEGVVLNERSLRRESLTRLEPFMVPQEFEFRAGLPRTPNGKVDRQGLASGSA
jgi:long-chain acyl-CoA synthetase